MSPRLATRARQAVTRKEAFVMSILSPTKGIVALSGPAFRLSRTLRFHPVRRWSPGLHAADDRLPREGGLSASGARLPRTVGFPPRAPEPSSRGCRDSARGYEGYRARAGPGPPRVA